MVKSTKFLYEHYWESKEGLEKFEDYERNAVLKNRFHPGERVLDLACGEGAVAEFLQSLGCQVTAFDISRKALKKAASRGIKTVWGNVENRLPFEDLSFDKVFWGDNVEHLFSPDKTLKEIYRILKPSGKLILSCPNMGYWRYRLYYAVFGTVPQTEWYRSYPWNWEHIRFFNKKVLEEFLVGNGFSITEFWGVSKRRLDKLLVKIKPDWFGMIMVAEAAKIK